MITYNKLFETLERRNLKKTDLLSVISSGSLAKLTKGQNIQTEVIEKICSYLNVQPSEIMEYYQIESITPIKEDEPLLYLTGYKQRIEIYTPSAYINEYDDEVQKLDEDMKYMIQTTRYISKKYYDNTEEIMNGKIPIPKTFINESTIKFDRATIERVLQIQKSKKDKDK